AGVSPANHTALLNAVKSPGFKPFPKPGSAVHCVTLSSFPSLKSWVTLPLGDALNHAVIWRSSIYPQPDSPCAGALWLDRAELSSSERRRSAPNAVQPHNGENITYSVQRTDCPGNRLHLPAPLTAVHGPARPLLHLVRDTLDRRL